MSTALVTGASGGIGLELARLLAADGHRLVLVARSAGQLERVASGLPDATAVTADLSTPEGVRAVRDAVGEVDVLVNNAGIGDFGPFAEAELARTLQMIQLNIVALTELTRAYLPGMLARESDACSTWRRRRRSSRAR